MIFDLGELFCGPGGIAYGALNARAKSDRKVFSLRHAWATDYDDDTCNTFARNICQGDRSTVICEDIRRLNLERLAKISSVDAIAFGFPCNDFSVVGEQRGINGTFGPLYKFAIKALRKFTPKWFLAENVSGLRNANDGQIFGEILRELHQCGYSVYPHLYSFDQYGVPQARQRIIIVGIRRDVAIDYRVPSPAPYRKIDVTSRNALENPPIREDAANNTLTRQSTQVIERLKWIKPGQNAFTADLPKNLRLNVMGAKISQIYKRLDPNKPAYTVTGSGGGGTHMYHWSEDRALTNRERARLQAFPDDFVFCGSKDSVRKQIGMAVPCSVAKIIVESILKSFAGIEYEFIQSSFEPILQTTHRPRSYQDCSAVATCETAKKQIGGYQK
jgi:DNA (cytosine-5)-methyltransferase 1